MPATAGDGDGASDGESQQRGADRGQGKLNESVVAHVSASSGSRRLAAVGVDDAVVAELVLKPDTRMWPGYAMSWRGMALASGTRLRRLTTPGRASAATDAAEACILSDVAPERLCRDREAIRHVHARRRERAQQLTQRRVLAADLGQRGQIDVAKRNHETVGHALVHCT